MPSSTSSSLALAIVAFVVVLTSNQQCDGQFLQKVRSEYGTNSALTYGPDDASFRSRLFNLHTAHSGAYYNCDGEEEKRHSPYIQWKTVRGRSLPPFLWDIRQWKRDKAEIAQRICDGGCCGSTQQTRSILKKRSRCSCQTCDAGCGGELPMTSNQDILQPEMLHQQTMSSTTTSPATDGKAGLLSSLKQRYSFSQTRPPTPKPTAHSPAARLKETVRAAGLRSSSKLR